MPALTAIPITTAQFLALPLDERRPPAGCQWHFVLGTAPDIQGDYEPCQYGTSYPNTAIGE